MVGPIAGAKVTDNAKTASPIGCCGFGNLVSTSVNAIGISTPPANPCNPRIAIMDGRSRLKGWDLTWQDAPETLFDTLDAATAWRLRACDLVSMVGITDMPGRSSTG